MNDYQDRVRKEQEELGIKILKLLDFIKDSNIFKKLEYSDKQLLKDQYDVMVKYNGLLVQRIARF